MGYQIIRHVIPPNEEFTKPDGLASFNFDEVYQILVNDITDPKKWWVRLENGEGIMNAYTFLTGVQFAKLNEEAMQEYFD